MRQFMLIDPVTVTGVGDVFPGFDPREGPGQPQHGVGICQTLSIAPKPIGKSRASAPGFRLISRHNDYPIARDSLCW